MEKCFVRKVGFRYYVDLHVVVRGDLTVRQGHLIAHAVADQVREQVARIAEVLVHIEPEEELLVGSHPGELMDEEVREAPSSVSYACDRRQLARNEILPVPTLPRASH